MNLKRAGTMWKNREMLRKKKKRERDKEKTQEWQIKMSVAVLTNKFWPS